MKIRILIYFPISVLLCFCSAPLRSKRPKDEDPQNKIIITGSSNKTPTEPIPDNLAQEKGNSDQKLQESRQDNLEEKQNETPVITPSEVTETATDEEKAKGTNPIPPSNERIIPELENEDSVIINPENLTPKQEDSDENKLGLPNYGNPDLEKQRRKSIKDAIPMGSPRRLLIEKMDNYRSKYYKRLGAIQQTFFSLFTFIFDEMDIKKMREEAARNINENINSILINVNRNTLQHGIEPANLGNNILLTQHEVNRDLYERERAEQILTDIERLSTNFKIEALKGNVQTPRSSPLTHYLDKAKNIEFTLNEVREDIDSDPDLRETKKRNYINLFAQKGIQLYFARALAFDYGRKEDVKTLSLDILKINSEVDKILKDKSLKNLYLKLTPTTKLGVLLNNYINNDRSLDSSKSAFAKYKRDKMKSSLRISVKNIVRTITPRPSKKMKKFGLSLMSFSARRSESDETESRDQHDRYSNTNSNILNRDLDDLNLDEIQPQEILEDQELDVTDLDQRDSPSQYLLTNEDDEDNEDDIHEAIL